MKAIWQDTVIAESDATVVVEGNHYFPLTSVNRALLQQSDTHTVCGWKGTASYYHITVGDALNRDAAWFYPSPKEAAGEIAGHIAFWRGVNIVD